MRPGEPIWFDDGKIGGIIREVGPERVSVEITQARAAGAKLGAEKGINAPDSNLCISALTETDLEALKFIVKHADIVGYSFVRNERDIHGLQKRLAELGGENLGIVFENRDTRRLRESSPAAARGNAQPRRRSDDRARRLGDRMRLSAAR